MYGMADKKALRQKAMMSAMKEKPSMKIPMKPKKDIMGSMPDMADVMAQEHGMEGKEEMEQMLLSSEEKAMVEKMRMKKKMMGGMDESDGEYA